MDYDYDDMYFCKDTRNKRGTKIEEKLNKLGSGLKMVSKSTNYKEMQKAIHRNTEQIKANAIKRRDERIRNREAAQNEYWKDKNSKVVKKLKRTEAKAMKNSLRLKEREENRKILQQEENSLKIFKSKCSKLKKEI